MLLRSDPPILNAQVRLLCGANVNLRPASFVQASIVNMPNQVGGPKVCSLTLLFLPCGLLNLQSKAKASGADAVSIKNNEALLREDGLAKFEEITFPLGTRYAGCWLTPRLKAVKLKFAMQVEVSDALGQRSTFVESVPTAPFIVLTNDNQWGEGMPPLSSPQPPVSS